MHALKKRFLGYFPDRFFLSDSIDEAESYLRSKSFLRDHEYIVHIGIPGEGNMNKVLRIITDQRSFIIKQARPWVEKYPSIEAPVERSMVEVTYYRSVCRNHWLKELSPTVLFSDPENYLMVTDDLGESSDYSFIYGEEETIDRDELSRLVTYLSELHGLEIDSFPDNRSMRVLNHEHIFHIPYCMENGLLLDAIQTGLMELAGPVKKDDRLKTEITRVGELYLQPGSALIHGDFFPGSWLGSSSGVKVIDPEFSFMGPPEFDMGVLFAHLFLARQGYDLSDILGMYEKPDGFNDRLTMKYAGIEILRRLIGVAQLPLSMTLEEKKTMIEKAGQWILNTDI